MAKKKKHEKHESGSTTTPPSKPSGKDPLHDAIVPFERGDYGRAKVALSATINDPSASEGLREQASELLDATKLERGTLWVGIACVGLLLLVIVVTAMTQP